MQCYLIYLVLGAVSALTANAQIDYRPEFKNYKNSDGEVLVNIDNPETKLSQYHTSNIDRSAYLYGYDVSRDGQFHHETRGPDGVTYGCYGYIDQNRILKATHYVADSQGYRTVEALKPVLIYPNELYDNSLKYEANQKRRGRTIDWQDLYFPIGCGMVKGGIPPNIPLTKQSDGTYAPIEQFNQKADTLAEDPINNQPIQNKAYNYYNTAPNSEQITDTNFNIQYTTSSSAQNYQHSNNNGYQEELYIDDAKDLHFSSHHGSHSTEFTSTHGHGGAGQTSSGGQSGSQSSSSNESQSASNQPGGSSSSNLQGSSGSGSGNEGGTGGGGNSHSTEYMSSQHGTMTTYTHSHSHGGDKNQNQQQQNQQHQQSNQNQQHQQNQQQQQSNQNQQQQQSNQNQQQQPNQNHQQQPNQNHQQQSNQNQQPQKPSSGQHNQQWNSGSNQYQHQPALGAQHGQSSNNQRPMSGGQESGGGYPYNGQSSSNQGSNQPQQTQSSNSSNQGGGSQSNRPQQGSGSGSSSSSYSESNQGSSTSGSSSNPFNNQGGSYEGSYEGSNDPNGPNGPINGPHGEEYQPGHNHPVSGGNVPSRPDSQAQSSHGSDPQHRPPSQQGQTQKPTHTVHPTRPTHAPGSHPTQQPQRPSQQTEQGQQGQHSQQGQQSTRPTSARPTSRPNSAPSNQQSGSSQSNSQPQSQTDPLAQPNRPNQPMNAQPQSGSGSPIGGLSQQQQQPRPTTRPHESNGDSQGNGDSQSSTQQSPPQQGQTQRPQQSAQGNQDPQSRPQRPQQGGSQQSQQQSGSGKPPQVGSQQGRYMLLDPNQFESTLNQQSASSSVNTDNENDPNLVDNFHWNFCVLPFPIDLLPFAIQNTLQNPAIKENFQNLIQNSSLFNQIINIQGSGQQTSPTQSTGSSQQSQTGSSQPNGQSPSQTDPSAQSNAPNNGMIGYIPIVFFPCNGQNGANGNQYGTPYPYQQQQQQQSGNNPCARCPGNSNAAQQRSQPLFGAISNARIFHNSDFNSVTQVFPRPVRSRPFTGSARKAKIDQKLPI